MAEFRTRLRMKPRLWLDCKVKELMVRPSRHGGYVMIRFENFPWLTVLDRMTMRALATRKYGPVESWPRDIQPEDLLPIGTLLNVKARSVEHEGMCHVSPRIMLEKVNG